LGLVFTVSLFIGGEPITAEQYIGNGRVTEFKYGKYLGEIFRKQNQQLSYLQNFGEKCIQIFERS
jgi:alpha-amylase